MGAKVSSLQSEEIIELQSESHFSYDEIQQLYNRFERIDTNKNGFLSTNDFMKIPELSMNPLAKQIMQLILGNMDQVINFRRFVHLLSTFHEKASNKERLKMIFDLYDCDKDGVINRSDLTTLFKQLVGSFLDDSELSVVVNATLEQSASGAEGLDFEHFSMSLDENAVSMMTISISPLAHA
eukprot:TRINITY_DN6071_c0_g1_i1.p1 TRINITY_DN6071_c0_g1~~TRINITY_DN6071_c0_g1_i1.p1  ORF type:complete len:182 (+),score=30.00 TRINITY_DN6071_c0_g1_i1:136-681(+)